jgi:hypothetical protein
MGVTCAKRFTAPVVSIPSSMIDTVVIGAADVGSSANPPARKL